MSCKIVLACETSDSSNRLLGSLAEQGILTTRRPTVRAAAAQLRAHETTASALIVDERVLLPGDEELIAEVRAQHPELKIVLFSPGTRWEEMIFRLQDCGDARVCSISMEDPAACEEILRFVTVEVASSSQRTAYNSYLHEEPVRSTDRDAQAVGSPHYTDEFLRRVGRSDVPVLLHGETGVGKEVMARKLWSYSSRVGKPFLKINCAALPSELIESELFGYEKGAFTGAIMDKPGKFEQAQDGTILLDEIGDMDTRLQAKLLQVLQDGEVQPLGSRHTIKVNVRILAATHRDLRAAIAQHTFREDLYYRLSVINLTIPPLRERRQEIMPLAQELLLRHAEPGSQPPPIPDRLQRLMLEHRWPGNVRELENVMRRFLVYQDATLLEEELTDGWDAPKPRLAVAKPPAAVQAAGQFSDRVSFDRFAEASRSAESKLLLETLEAVRWNRRQAAVRLNIEYKALLYKLQKHGIVESKSKRSQVIA